MEEHQQEFASNGANSQIINEITQDNNSLGLWEIDNMKIIFRKVQDDWLLNSSQKTQEEYNKLLKMKSDEIQSLQLENLEYDRKNNEVYQSRKKITTDVDSIVARHETCKSFYEQIKKTVKYCLLFKQKITRVNNELVADINKFNGEMRFRRKIYEDEINQLNQLLNQQTKEYNQQCIDYTKNSEQLQKIYLQLEEEKDKLLYEIKDVETNISSLQIELQDICKEKEDLLLQHTELQEKLDYLKNDFESVKCIFRQDIEDLQVNLLERKNRVSETQDHVQKLKNEIDEQNEILNDIKKQHDELERVLLDSEQEYNVLEEQYESVLKGHELEFGCIKSRLIEKQQIRASLDDKNILADKDHVTLISNLEGIQQEFEDLNAKLVKYTNLDKELEKKLETLTSIKQQTDIDKNKKICHIMKEVERTKAECNDYSTKREDLLKQIEDAQAALTKIKNDVDISRQEIKYKQENDSLLIKNLNIANKELEQKLDNINEDLNNLKLSMEEKHQNLVETSRNEIDVVMQSLRSYKVEKQLEREREAKSYSEKKKSLEALLKSKELEIEQLSVTLENMQKDLQNKKSKIVELKSLTNMPQTNEFLYAKQKNRFKTNSVLSDNDSILNISAGYNYAQKDRPTMAENKELWSSSSINTTGGNFLNYRTQDISRLYEAKCKNQEKSLTDSDYKNTTSDTDSDDIPLKKRRTFRKPRGGKTQAKKQTKK